MSQHPTVAPVEPGAVLGSPPRSGAPSGSARSAIVATLLTLGCIASAVVVLWQPWGERDSLSYADIAPNRDAAWLGAVVDGLGFAAIGIALGLAVCMLARRRGAVWANVGAVMCGIGGVAFCAGMTAFGSLAWYATGTDVIDAEAGTALLSAVESEVAHLLAVQMAGFLLFTVGSLLLMVALWRSAAVPRWLPIAFVALSVAVFALDGVLLNIVQAAQLLLPIVVAAALVRRRP